MIYFPFLIVFPQPLIGGRAVVIIFIEYEISLDKITNTNFI